MPSPFWGRPASTSERYRDFANALIRQALHLSGGTRIRRYPARLKRTTFVEMLKRKSLDAGEPPAP